MCTLDSNAHPRFKRTTPLPDSKARPTQTRARLKRSCSTLASSIVGTILAATILAATTLVATILATILAAITLAATTLLPSSISSTLSACRARARAHSALARNRLKPPFLETA